MEESLQENYNHQHNHDGVNSPLISRVNFSEGLISSSEFVEMTASLDVLSFTSVNNGKDRVFLVGGYLNITAIATNSVALQVVYYDETGALNTRPFFAEGTTDAAYTTTGAYNFPPMVIKAKANFPIVIQTNCMGAGSQTYNVGAFINQLF